MKKKTPNKRLDPAREGHVQFRPGPLLGAVLAIVAAKWKVTTNEAARRLAALAAFELDTRHYDAVRKVADTMIGAPDFVDACQRIQVELATTNRVRNESGHSPLTEEERQERIRSFVQVLDQYELPEEQDEKKVSIKQYRD